MPILENCTAVFDEVCFERDMLLRGLRHHCGGVSLTSVIVFSRMLEDPGFSRVFKILHLVALSVSLGMRPFLHLQCT